MRVLAFDTTGPVLTVGTAADSQLIARRDAVAQRGSGNLLERLIDAVLDISGWARQDVQGLGLVTGPGSLTAIRIAWATAAGWAQSTGIQLAGWNLPAVHRRAMNGLSDDVACCVHYRGDLFLLYDLGLNVDLPQQVRLAGGVKASVSPTRLTGPGVIGNRDRWLAYFDSSTTIAEEQNAIVGGDTLAVWTESDLLSGKSLPVSSSPLEYGLPPDFKTHIPK